MFILIKTIQGFETWLYGRGVTPDTASRILTTIRRVKKRYGEITLKAEDKSNLITEALRGYITKQDNFEVKKTDGGVEIKIVWG